MKKIVLILFSYMAITACNNAGNNTARQKDSLDSVANAQTERIDSVTERKKDSLNRLDTANRRDTSR